MIFSHMMMKIIVIVIFRVSPSRAGPRLTVFSKLTTLEE